MRGRLMAMFIVLPLLGAAASVSAAPVAPVTETTAPETTAPETTSPETTSPDVTAPETTSVDPAAPVSAAQRGDRYQLTATLPPPPPPTTTTTTTLPPPDPTLLPLFSGTGRRLVYSLSAQRVWAVESNGEVVKTHLVSGKRAIPYPGTYSVFSKSLYTRNIDNPNIKWMYMVRFTKGPGGDNIGFHEIPEECDPRTGRCWKLQTEAQLGRALSGGCIRQATPDAEWVYRWAPVGTKVVVLP
jgi:lipoprotein-anchoring transpeptidase ErfK/SrfK